LIGIIFLTHNSFLLLLVPNDWAYLVGGSNEVHYTINQQYSSLYYDITYFTTIKRASSGGRWQYPSYYTFGGFINDYTFVADFVSANYDDGFGSGSITFTLQCNATLSKDIFIPIGNPLATNSNITLSGPSYCGP